MASLIFNWKLVEAESRILKQSSEKGATIFRTSQVLKDLGMFVRGEMFTDVKCVLVFHYQYNRHYSLHLGVLQEDLHWSTH